MWNADAKEAIVRAELKSKEARSGLLCLRPLNNISRDGENSTHEGLLVLNLLSLVESGVNLLSLFKNSLLNSPALLQIISLANLLSIAIISDEVGILVILVLGHLFEPINNRLVTGGKQHLGVVRNGQAEYGAAESWDRIIFFSAAIVVGEEGTTGLLGDGVGATVLGDVSQKREDEGSTLHQ